MEEAGPMDILASQVWIIVEVLFIADQLTA